MKAITVTELGIKRASGYGQYYVTAVVNGESIKAHTTNSEAFDWFYDDSDEEKHIDARSYVWSLALRTYENL